MSETAAVNRGLLTALPRFWRELADSSVSTVMVCGCGGGFDFVHGLLLYPLLKSLGKQVVFLSYSFGKTGKIHANARVVFNYDGTVAKQVDARSQGDAVYAPEIHVCDFLDRIYPEDKPHSVYACNAREYTVPSLRFLYQKLVSDHAVDAIILMDGGSDSLMVGDEESLGDPIEDAVSITTVAELKQVKLRTLICVGLGVDRYNHVSDAASLRAIAELTALGGFKGAISFAKGDSSFDFYRRALSNINMNQSFRSAAAGLIVAAAEGVYGGEQVPPGLKNRLEKQHFFVWPLMAMLWAFDIDKVAERSKIGSWIRNCESPEECWLAIQGEREKLGKRVRSVENLPRHEDLRQRLD